MCGKNDAASLIDYSDNRAEIRSGERKLLTGGRVLAYGFHTQCTLYLGALYIGEGNNAWDWRDAEKHEILAASFDKLRMRPCVFNGSASW
jgi:hypothetical protein